MPISTPIDSVSDYGGDPEHFEHVLHYLFEPALKHVGYDMLPPSISNSQLIQAEIIRNLETADLVLCDISTWNANVFFELGIRVALDGPVALVRDSNTSDIPFDTALVSCHTYNANIAPWCLPGEIEELAEFARNAGAQNRNALWRYFGITQRASVPTSGDPVQEKLDLVLALLQMPNLTVNNAKVSKFEPLREGDQLGHQMAMLTSREQEVLVLLALGMSNAEVARKLYISEYTVKSHLAHVMTKLGVREKSQAVIAAYQSGLIESGSSPMAPASPEHQ